jgi:hypothetical protein
MKAHVLALAAGALLLHSTAHAWFFFLPGSLFAGKGDTCVAESAKVGDTINKNGSAFVVKAISGKSSRCSNSDHPILVEVEARPQDNNVTQARIDIPDGWVQQPVTDSLKTGGVVMYATNKTLDAGLQLATWKRAGITDVGDFVASRKALQTSRLKESEQFPTTRLIVSGLPAWRYELRGRAPNGIDIKYTATIVESEQEIVGVLAWTTAAGFEQTRERLVSIADSIAGLVPPVVASSPQQAAAPTLAPKPISVSGVVEATGPADDRPASREQRPSGQGSQAAQKLRELNSLYKDGVITREEFEGKKKQLLETL